MEEWRDEWGEKEEEEKRWMQRDTLSERPNVWVGE